MNKNFVWTIVLSIGILWGWEYFVMKPRRPAPAPLPAGAPAAAPASSASAPAATAVPAPSVAAAPDKTRLVEYAFGINRVSFNLQGASVHQWEIQENDAWTALVPAGHADRALETFPDIAF